MKSGRAVRALIAARDEAERANLAKSLFLSHMSHELRTPLNAILGFAQLLETDLAQPLAAAHRRPVGEIVRGGRHLLHLINDVLDLQRIEAGKLELELQQVALAPLVQQCVQLVDPLASARQVMLLPLPLADLDVVVQADPVRLQQVLLNLLSNAIKYNRVGGEVQISGTVLPSGQRLSIRDTGIGLTRDELARLFTPFERLHADLSTVEGAGIGLALSQRLMQAMGGQIGVHSQPRVGSNFWIELRRPRRRRALPARASLPAAEPAATGGVASHHVLYIEDNAVNIVLMEAMLARLPGVHLSSEMTPEAGLAHALREPPELILLDIQLPGMSGYEVLHRLRESALTSRIPVIAVSANAMPEDITEGRAAGFVAYITKPVELATLLAAVQAARVQVETATTQHSTLS